MSRTTLLVNLGTTRAPEAAAVRAFLDEFLSDPMVVDYPKWFWKPILRGIILRSRPPKVAKLYESIWSPEGSPLDVETRAMVTGLQALVSSDVEVRYAYRYGAPSIPSELERAQGAKRTVTVIPLFPQRTGSTTGTVERLVASEARRLDIDGRVRVGLIAPHDEGYVTAQAERWREAIGEERPEHLVVSFHGIPKRYDRSEGHQYRRDCETTHHALLAKLDWPPERATLAYQSKFGPEPWIRPTTADVIATVGRNACRALGVMTPGFLTEGLETIEEIGIQGREAFHEAGGGTFLRASCIGAHPALLRSLAAIVDRP